MTQVTVPFEGPAMYATMQFSCPVVRGDVFSVRMADGRTVAL